VSSSSSSFSTSKRGFAPDEVNAFLETYVAPLEEELDAAKAQIGRLENEIAEARTRDEAMQVTLLAATMAVTTKPPLTRPAPTPIRSSAMHAAKPSP